MTWVDELRANWTRGQIEWRRLRYAEAGRAAQALDLVRRAGFMVELRLRRFTRRASDTPDTPPVLLAGTPRKVWAALDQMAPDFGLAFDAVTEATRPVPGVWTPGHFAAQYAGDTDALVAPGGMFVRLAGKGVKDASRGQGDEIELPAPELGLDAAPPLPFKSSGSPTTVVWSVGDGGLPAPAGIFGEPDTRRAFLAPLALGALGSGGRPTVVIDGGDGQLALWLRQQPAVAGALAGGHAQEISLTRAGQVGFNPLADALSGSGDDTLARWLWFWRGTGVAQDHLEAAFTRDVRSLPDLLAFLNSDRRMVGSAHAARRLADAEQGVIGTWLAGAFDVAGHLAGGGHLLVDCPASDGPRLRALRGLIGLAMEADARLVSFGPRWPDGDDRALAWLDAVVDVAGGRRYPVTAFTRCAPEQAITAAGWHGEVPGLAEYLRTLPDGTALVNEGDEWWTLTATHG